MCPTMIVHHFAIVLYQFGDIIGDIVTIIVSVTPQNSSAVNECMPCTHDNCLSRAFLWCLCFKNAGCWHFDAFVFERGAAPLYIHARTLQCFSVHFHYDNHNLTKMCSAVAMKLSRPISTLRVKNHPAK